MEEITSLKESANQASTGKEFESGGEEEDDLDKSLDADELPTSPGVQATTCESPTRDSSRKIHSKYDMVKVKVRVEDGHFYVLSRYLISRILKMIKVPDSDAIKIALNIKKALVKQDVTEIPHANLEQLIFQELERGGFGPQFVGRFKMLSKFQQKRQPLIILMAGTLCMGKQNLVNHLPDVFNVSNILTTRLVRQVQQSLGVEEECKAPTLESPDYLEQDPGEVMA